jgi:hypothetical protein
MIYILEILATFLPVTCESIRVFEAVEKRQIHTDSFTGFLLKHAPSRYVCSLVHRFL